jgi:hypothetical protein
LAFLNLPILALNVLDETEGPVRPEWLHIRNLKAHEFSQARTCQHPEQRNETIIGAPFPCCPGEEDIELFNVKPLTCDWASR